jgi:hypothetical protein
MLARGDAETGIAERVRAAKLLGNMM